MTYTKSHCSQPRSSISCLQIGRKSIIDLLNGFVYYSILFDKREVESVIDIQLEAIIMEKERKWKPWQFD
jgi:hypothetical protein